jgi:hypothetical protein
MMCIIVLVVVYAHHDTIDPSIVPRVGMMWMMHTNFISGTHMKLVSH